MFPEDFENMTLTEAEKDQFRRVAYKMWASERAAKSAFFFSFFFFFPLKLQDIEGTV